MNKRTDQPRWTPRRLLSLLMALIMTLSLLPTAALAADPDSLVSGTGSGTQSDPFKITCTAAINGFGGLNTLNTSVTDPDNGSITLRPRLEYTRSDEYNSYSYNESITFNVGFCAVNSGTSDSTVNYSVTVEQLNGTSTVRGATVSATLSDTVKDNDYKNSNNGILTAKVLDNSDTIHLRYTFSSGSTSLGTIYVDVTSFTFNVYTVTYSHGDGDQLTTGAVKADKLSGETYTIPSDAKATKANATFTGWLASGGASGTYQPGGEITGITGDFTLTAQFEDNHTVTFDPVYNGVSGYLSSATSQGTKYTLPALTPKLDGATFLGWDDGNTMDAATGKLKLFQPGEEITGITRNITLTANWDITGVTPVGKYTVKYVRQNLLDYGSLKWPVDQTANAGESITISDITPTADGYTFLGWSTDPNANVAKYSAGTVVTDENLTLYAVWKEKNYTITYQNNATNGVTCSLTTQSVTPGTAASFRLTVAAGYNADTMSVEANGAPLGYSTKVENSDGSTTYAYSFVPTGDTTVTISQPEQTSYVVTLPGGDHFTAKFGGSGDENKSDRTVDYNGSVSFTVKADNGWTIEGVSYTGDAKLSNTGDNYTLNNIKSNVSVSVKMSQIPVYTVSYFIDSLSSITQSFNDAQDVDAAGLFTPSPRTGYEFDGWYTSPNCTGNKVTTLTVDKDVNLYGRFKPITSEIMYNLNAGSDQTYPASIDPTPKVYGQAAVLSAVVPTRTGYDFLGWAKEENKSLVVYAAGATVSEEIPGGMRLYAVWAKKELTVTVNAGTGTSFVQLQPLSVEYGSTFQFAVVMDKGYEQNTPTVTFVSGTDDPQPLTGASVTAESLKSYPISVMLALSAAVTAGQTVYLYTTPEITQHATVNISATNNAVFDVTFEYAGLDAAKTDYPKNGDVYQTAKVSWNETVAQPSAPSVDGYRFTGWYNEDGTAFDFNTPIQGSTTVLAKFEAIRPVITIAQMNGEGWELTNWKVGDTPVTPGTKNTFTVAYGATISFDLVVDEGYQYNGSVSVAANGFALAPSGDPEVANGKTTIHFLLAPVTQDTRITVSGITRKTVTITYNDNALDHVSGMPSPQTVKYYLDGKTNDTIINQTPTRIGYEFLGWSINSNATQPDNGYDVAAITSASGATAAFTQDTTLYAVWKAVETHVTLSIADVPHTSADGKRVVQYEGEKITLQAKLDASAKGTIEFYKGTSKDGTTGKSLVGSAAINGMTAELIVPVGEYKTGGVNEYYWAVFKSESAEGFADSTNSNIMEVGIFSKALSWPLSSGAVVNGSNVLNVYQGNSTNPANLITDAMVAGSTYTLEVKTDSITGVETLDIKKPKLGEDYKIVWQYYEVDKNDWVTADESSEKATYLVTGKYSGYQFRAQIVPLGPSNGSLYIKAGKFVSGVLQENAYDVCLYTEPTTATALQSTTTALSITGATSEAADVKINGQTDMFNTIGSHLAQFEGQTVTLTATVTEDTTAKAAVSTGYVNFYRKDATGSSTLLNSTPVAVGANGVATYTATITAWDTSKNAANNKDEFYAEYLVNETYNTSSSENALRTVYIMSTTIKTPVIDVDGDTATTYDANVEGLLAGVKHTFTLRTDASTADYSVVALDGRTVSSSDYTIQWITKTGDNTETSSATGKTFTTTDNKVGDEIYVRLNPTGNMKTGADSMKAIIGAKQGVTVTVTANKDWVYQLNPITLTATVAAKEANATMKPNGGTVTFYYSVDSGATWTKVGETQNLTTTGNTVSAIISPIDLPVKAGDNTKQDVTITAVYSGDATFKASGNYDETTNAVSAGTAANGVTDKAVTVYSSVVYVDSAENTTNTPGKHGIIITAEGDKVLANETKVNLTLSDVYTLDHATDADDKAALAYGTDYTVQWQVLSNAASYSANYASSETPWQNISGATGVTCQIDVEQGAAYRAVITVKDTPIAKGSYEAIKQNDHPGRQVYYSNILVAASAPASLSVNINTSNTNKGYEGIVEGETVTIHTFTSGATGTTPISKLTVSIYEGKTIATGAEPVFTAEKSNVNGHVSFDWETAKPGYYTLHVNASFTNGYSDQTIEKQLIVRDNDYSFTVSGDNAVYNGKVQGLNVEVAGMDIEAALAQKSVVVYYYTDEARTQQVEPTQAGTYYATIRLQESAYWTEKTQNVTFTILPREVSVVDLIAQAKVYDGTTNANIQEIILNDATVDSTTGLPNADTGIIDGDSVYATGTGYTSLVTAGTVDLGVKNVTLAGDDAANYKLASSSYTEEFNIQRNQVKGALISSGTTYQYTGKDIKLSANDIYLIDQAGNALTNYTVTYYYHNGDGVETVDAMNKLGKYTVIARPEQSNYKGGASTTVYVGETAVPGTLDKTAESALISITNTVKLYDGQSTGVTVSATKGTASASYYYDGAWEDTAPTAAGRYLVKATVTNGSVTDTAYGIYTIVKARPELTLNATGTTYTSAQISGTPTGTFNGGSFPAGTYYTYTGGTIQGVAYEAPTEAGKYIVTAHVPETENYTAHEISAAFEITRAPLTITADDFSRQQYGAYPALTASFRGLATGGIAADTSLRDVQIQPELIDDSDYTNDASDQVGNQYSITAVSALARNYDVSYVKGNMSVTREDPKPYLEIRGMIENGNGETNRAYYGDVIQLYAYGNQSKETNVVNTSSTLEWSVTGPATITENGLMTITGVGDVTVTLKRGYGAQQISTTLTFTAHKQEVKVVIPNQDRVYSGTEQRYDGNKFSAENRMGATVSASPYSHDGLVTRTNVGSQIITAWVGDNANFQSEHYGGLFTINVKDVTVTPNEATTTYGSKVTSLGYAQDGIVNNVEALPNGMAVSIADAYNNLDVYDGYEILVAGKENENYNVKYITDQDAPDVKVNPLNLTVSTGTLNEQVGMTSGSLNPNGKYPVNGAVVDSNVSMGAANTRMYGEPNWVMDDTLTSLISGDSLADLLDLNSKLVSFNYGIGADANVSYSDKSTKLKENNGAGPNDLPNYEVETGSSMIAFGNYNETYTKGTQNIYQRPVTLALREGLTKLTAYKPEILSGDTVTEAGKQKLLTLIVDNLDVKQYNNNGKLEGGLATLLNHTVEDLKIQIKSVSKNGDKLTVTIKLGNQNYWINANNELQFEIDLVSTKIVPVYSQLNWTSFSVTMYDETKSAPVDVSGNVQFFIYQKKDGVELKYSNYKNETIIRSGTMTATGNKGQFIANFDRLPAGDYAYFAIAQNYTIVE